MFGLQKSAQRRSLDDEQMLHSLREAIKLLAEVGSVSPIFTKEKEEEILKEIEKDPSIQVVDLAKKINVHPTTLAKFLQRRPDISGKMQIHRRKFGQSVMLSADDEQKLIQLLSKPVDMNVSEIAREIGADLTAVRRYLAKRPELQKMVLVKSVKPSAFTKDVEQKFKELAADFPELTATEMALELGIRPGTLMKVLRSRPELRSMISVVKRSGRETTAMTKEVIGKVRTIVQNRSGMRVSDVAREVGVHPPTLHSWLRTTNAGRKMRKMFDIRMGADKKNVNELMRGDMTPTRSEKDGGKVDKKSRPLRGYVPDQIPHVVWKKKRVII